MLTSIIMRYETSNYTSTYHFRVTCLTATNQRTKCIFRFQGATHHQNMSRNYILNYSFRAQMQYQSNLCSVFTQMTLTAHTHTWQSAVIG